MNQKKLTGYLRATSKNQTKTRTKYDQNFSIQ